MTKQLVQISDSFETAEARACSSYKHCAQAAIFDRVMAPTIDSTVQALTHTIQQLESRVHDLEARLHNRDGGSGQDSIRMILMGPPGAGM